MRADVGHQGIENRGTLIAGNHAQRQRHGLRGLAALVVPVMSSVEKSRVESRAHTLGLLAVDAAFGLHAEQRGGFFHRLQILVINRGCRHAGRSQLRKSRRAGSDVVPVAQPVIDDAALCARSEILNVGAHHVKLRGQERAVAGALVDIPGRKNGGAAPLRRIVEDRGLHRIEDHILRRDLRNQACLRAFAALLVGNVARGGGVESGEIEVVKHGRREQVRLLEPAQLFAVRAIGEQAHRVVLNGMQNQRVDAIEQCVGRRKCANLFG